ncbi:hypothetical protein ACFYS8_36330 [Kitasatospora sp. NPDC004615]|uniref:hypothetical protein n=1 Tax=Kitasatospora sp. NPDC004615 TaxID=3364017 RepID=UPI0036A41D64
MTADSPPSRLGRTLGLGGAAYAKDAPTSPRRPGRTAAERAALAGDPPPPPPPPRSTGHRRLILPTLPATEED